MRRVFWVLCGATLLGLPACMDRLSDEAGSPFFPSSPSPGQEATDFVSVPLSHREADAPPRLIGRQNPTPLAAIDPGTSRTSPEVAPGAKQPTIEFPSDGSVIYDRVGWMVRDDKTRAWMFVFRESPSPPRPCPPMEILPGPFLAEMETIVAEQAPASVTFHLTAEAARYHGRGFLVVRMAMWERPASAEAGRR